MITFKLILKKNDGWHPENQSTKIGFMVPRALFNDYRWDVEAGLLS